MNFRPGLGGPPTPGFGVCIPLVTFAHGRMDFVRTLKRKAIYKSSQQSGLAVRNGGRDGAEERFGHLATERVPDVAEKRGRNEQSEQASY